MFEVLRRHDRGAAAVEFALVSVALFPLLFGVVDYGIYLADVMSVQRAAGQVARSATLPPAAGLPVVGDVVGGVGGVVDGVGGVVDGVDKDKGKSAAKVAGGLPVGGGEPLPCRPGADASQGTPLLELGDLDLRQPLDRALCGVFTSVDTLTGSLSARVAVVPPVGAPAGTWGTGSSLRVCVLADHSALTPFTPLPNGGRIQSRVDMPVEPQPAVLLEVPERRIESPSEDGAAKDWTWCDA